MFLNRSSCELQTLSLKGFTITDTELLELLPLLPALESLVLSESSKAPGAAITSQLIEALGQFVPDAGHTHHPPFFHLPLLHSLELRGAFIGDVELLAMLDARTEGESRQGRLKYVTVGVMEDTDGTGETYTTNWTEASLQKLESLKDRGVSVVVDTC